MLKALMIIFFSIFLLIDDNSLINDSNIQGSYMWNVIFYEGDGRTDMKFNDFEGDLEITNSHDEFTFEIYNAKCKGDINQLKNSLINNRIIGSTQIEDNQFLPGSHSEKLKKLIKVAFNLREMFEDEYRLKSYLMDLYIENKLKVNEIKEIKNNRIYFEIIDAAPSSDYYRDKIKGNFNIFNKEDSFFESHFELYTITSCCITESIGFVKMKKKD